MIKIQCMILGGTELLVQEINEFAQLYVLDDCRLQVVRGNQSVTFDVPSTEWLKRFTEILKNPGSRTYRETLRASGYKLDVRVEEGDLTIMVFDIGSSSVMPLDLSHGEAVELHDTVLNCLLTPFLNQGGRLDQLGDVIQFSCK